ncbi:MAG TPA: DUF4412 domain-containing protein [Bacteroidia bacterium]|jgi:GLPGLI family protein|nr:DUF4412 domain-containing protein [Bacteroidia bacterium]HQF27792.1 DUF4412 domain-containing protein [Bacteroidia bacterium]HQK97142.1 DUF4412 domain-containing protein [Bacteroidia bacterium]
MSRFCFLVFLFVITVSHNLFSQINEGKITYSLSFPDLDLPAAQKAFLPTESITYFKNGKSRSESEGLMGMKTITISTDKEIIMLIDVMGNKSAVRKDVSEETKPSKVEITSEKKNIAGYNCQKAIISNGADDKIIMWVTKSITGGGNWGGTFDKIEGAPMEFSMNNGGINFKMSAISVKEEKINDNLFVIPEGYKEMTEKEIKETLFNK